MAIEPVVIEKLDDWKKIVGEQCGVIVDAMTYRTAEIFFLGAEKAVQASNLGDEDAVWLAMMQNVTALQTFIDTLILRSRLPMIAYWMTFGQPDLRVDEKTIALIDSCNQSDDILIPIQLTHDSYDPLKRAAIETLNRDCPPLTDELRQAIVPDLNAFDYQWHPDLRDVDGFDRLSEEDKLLTIFLFGRVLFDAYAEASGSDAIFQPKLAKLHLLSSLRRDEDRSEVRNSPLSGLEKLTRAHDRESVEVGDLIRARVDNYHPTICRRID